MLYSKIILVKWNSHNKRSFVPLGYKFTHYGDLFEVDVNNAPKYSRELIILKCDYCGKLYVTSIERYYVSKTKTIPNDCCEDCLQIKAKECVTKRYGVDNIFKKGDYILECNKRKNDGLHHTQTQGFKEKYLIGEKSRGWKGGLSYDEERRKTPQEKAWRKAVYEKDKYTCQSCGNSKGGNLNAHHIYPYALYKDLRFDVNNGVTLCEDCHKLFHKIYGKTNIGLKEIEEFINKKVYRLPVMNVAG